MGEAPDSRVGSMFGPYHLKRLLGRGGMGEVYEAEHTVKEWTVAVKLMSETFSKDPVFRERMKREARITGRLQGGCRNLTWCRSTTTAKSTGRCTWRCA